MDTVTALVGERAAELALVQAEPGTEICREARIPCSPMLSVRQNAAQFRILLDRDKTVWLGELLDASGLKKDGWNKRFRKDQPGRLRLWGILTALLTRPKRVLAIEPMAGMTSADREALGRLIVLGMENGIEIRFTASRLQDVIRLGIPCKVRFSAPNGWRDTDSSVLEAAYADAGPESVWDEIQKKWEA